MFRAPGIWRRLRNSELQLYFPKTVVLAKGIRRETPVPEETQFSELLS